MAAPTLHPFPVATASPMSPSFAQILKLSMALVLASAWPVQAAAPPNAELAAAQQAVSRADSADGDQYAAEQLATARNGLAQAQAAMASREYKDALALSLAACKVCMRVARDPERNGFAAETEWTGRLLATEETQRRVAEFLAGTRR